MALSTSQMTALAAFGAWPTWKDNEISVASENNRLGARMVPVATYDVTGVDSANNTA
jgi:hypothetical protein